MGVFVVLYHCNPPKAEWQPAYTKGDPLCPAGRSHCLLNFVGLPRLCQLADPRNDGWCS